MDRIYDKDKGEGEVENDHDKDCLDNEDDEPMYPLTCRQLADIVQFIKGHMQDKTDIQLADLVHVTFPCVRGFSHYAQLDDALYGKGTAGTRFRTAYKFPDEGDVVDIPVGVLLPNGEMQETGTAPYIVTSRGMFTFTADDKSEYVDIPDEEDWNEYEQGWGGHGRGWSKIPDEDWDEY